ncbi:MAG: stage IV sporulation protein A [Christensenellales bacterium]|jgi:stage IV sporulation protein A
MNASNIYSDIAERTQGDIYIGVVGPVRTGKSTFIKQFMDQMVLPNMADTAEKERVVDELPQSASGRSIMTTQPHFVPNEAVGMELEDNVRLNVRMVDCVGYLVNGAVGYAEENAPRMVRTPWFEEEIPFEQAAELGTRKVITDHSTIGVVVTTDGSFSDIPRENYVAAEERVIKELKELGKPFVVMLNSVSPTAENTMALKENMAVKYDMPIIAANVMRMGPADITDMLKQVLYEFPLKSIHLDVPDWIMALPSSHWLVEDLNNSISNSIGDISKVRDYEKLRGAFDESEFFETPSVKEIQLGEGSADFNLPVKKDLFYKVLEEECGYPVKGEYHLLSTMKELVKAKKGYDRIAGALESVKATGYGMVSPSMNEMELEEPQIVKQGNRFGVRLKASAPSLHLIRVDIQSEVSPIVGTEKQSEELVKYLLSEFENDPGKIWNTNIFGKSLNDLVKENLASKLNNMPDEARVKIQETLQRIVNEGSGGLICILL